MVGRRLLRPPGDDDEHRPVAEPAHEEREHFERGRVGPVDVVDDEHAGLLRRWSPRRERARRRRGNAPARPDRRASASAACRARGRGAPPRQPDASLTAVASPSRSALRMQLDRAAERELRLALDAARRGRDAAVLAHARDELVGEACLADPHLAVEHDETALGADAASTRRAARRARARDRRAGADACATTASVGPGAAVAAFADRVVDGGRLLGRCDAELAVEDPDAVAVLRERGGALAARAVERDEPAVRGLVERIEREPASRVLDRAHARSRSRRSRRRAGRGRHRARARATPRETTASRRRRRCPAARSRRGTVRGEALPPLRDRASFVARGEAVELRDVHLAAFERDGVPRHRHPDAAERRTQRRESPAKRCARAVGRVLRPEETREGVAIVDAALDREIREQRGRLARVDRERNAVAERLRRAEERQPQGRVATRAILDVTARKA